MSNRQKARAVAVPPKQRAALAYVHPGGVRGGFMFSVVRSMCHEIGTTGLGFMLIDQMAASGQLVEARNQTVTHFLNETDCDWFWCVDSDMGFEADTLDRLISSADPDERPVVGALCFGQKKNGENYDLRTVDLRCFPTLYDWRESDDEVGFQVMTDYPRDQLVEVKGTGAACFIVHRTVLEEIAAQFGAEWFTPVQHPKGKNGPTTFSEDLSFFVRVAAVGAPVFVDTSIKTSHDKGGVYLDEGKWDEQEFLRVNLLESDDAA